VFCHDKVKPLSEAAKEASIRAVAALGLDFGGVDILVKKDGSCAVLEVNSAPGIEGTTLDKYAEAINATVGAMS
jgi:glutathione synthase/RimK-type ligase-like ATP-grasp enzyme